MPAVYRVSTCAHQDVPRAVPTAQAARMSMARLGRRPLSRIATLLLAAGLVALPVRVRPPEDWGLGGPAWGRPDGGDRGNGGKSESGGGPDHAGKPERDSVADDGGPGRGKGRGPSGGTLEPSGSGYGLGRLVDRLAGQDRGGARARYERALEGKRPQPAGIDDAELEVAVELTPAQTTALLRQGWARHARLDESWRNHGERVRTMVAIAKALGHPASVGALQANFGTPFENGLEPVAAGDWSVVNLDVNGDGAVDRLDLAALDALAAGKKTGGSDEGAEGDQP
jgi:hypothetical protein